MQTTKTIDLDPPIANGGGKIAQITLREPRTGEVLKAEMKLGAVTTPATRHARDIELIKLVAGIPDEAVRQLPITTFNEIITYLDGFVEAPEGIDYSKSRPPDLQLPLDPPIELHNTRYDELDLREPLTGELEKAFAELGAARDPASIRRFQILLVALASGCHRGVIERVPVTLLDEAFRYLAGFTGAGRRIGAI